VAGAALAGNSFGHAPATTPLLGLSRRSQTDRDRLRTQQLRQLGDVGGYAPGLKRKQLGLPVTTQGISRSLDVTVLVCASARRQIAGLAEYPDPWHERIARHPNCVCRDVSQETVFWTIRKGLRIRKIRPVIGCVEVMRVMHSRRRALVFAGGRRCRLHAKR
jgi:hypothetical protein